MSTSSHLVPVLPITPVPEGTVDVLRAIFNLSVSEYVLLAQCDRDRCFKTGLDSKDLTPTLLRQRDTLAQKSYIEFNVSTERWELTRSGTYVMRYAGICINSVEHSHQGKAEVIEMPRRDNSA